MNRRVHACDESPDDPAARAILALLGKRAPPATICPSEAARALSPDDWRPLMPAVREAARRLALAGRLRITQRGATLDPAAEWVGAIRLAHPLR